MLCTHADWRWQAQLLTQQPGSPDIVVPDGLQVVVQLIDQRHTSGDLQAGDVLVRDVVKVFHLRGDNGSRVS